MSIKEESVRDQKRLKHINYNKSRTGKSKEYINKLQNIGCPNGQRKCAYCTKKTANIKKKEWICNCKKEYIQDIQDEIKEESEFIIVKKLKK